MFLHVLISHCGGRSMKKGKRSVHATAREKPRSCSSALLHRLYRIDQRTFRLPPVMVTLTKRRVYFRRFMARPLGFFFFSCGSTCIHQTTPISICCPSDYIAPYRKEESHPPSFFPDKIFVSSLRPSVASVHPSIIHPIHHLAISSKKGSVGNKGKNPPWESQP